MPGPVPGKHWFCGVPWGSPTIALIPLEDSATDVPNATEAAGAARGVPLDQVVPF